MFSNIWVRLIGAAVVAGAFWFAIHTVNGWHEDANKLPQVQGKLDAVLKSSAEQYKHDKETISAYRKNIEDLRDAANAEPAPVVRMCKRAPVSAAANPASGVDGAAAASGGVAPTNAGDDQAGPDIGPDLIAEALRCDTISEQLRALQAWVESTLTDAPSQ